MNIAKLIAAFATAVVAVTGAAAVAAPQPAAAQPTTMAFDACDLRVKLRELRGWDANDRYNIMVWKESARASSHFDGIVSQGHTTADECDGFFGNDIDFFWVVFSGGGAFTRQGDGGYRNWAFYGVWERNGKHVEFSPR
ncbi:hypothetical protein [Streptomonospora litoralis]|uniref:Stress response protein YvgO n=1 Tax=Streptomonospora litoralis TaxID=2498135 RepID=A0A4P6Q0K0_9ACTN|nr:hypothetical protein [Streptomonospora litoralis]QBI54068.1 Stress response protein YvgO precursor [Streptomonospora litoralis]